MKDTTAIGAITESKVLSALLKHGDVFLPFKDNSRCDMIFDKDGKLFKVQCKTATYENGVIKFRNYNVTSKGHTQYSADEVDYYGIYCPKLNKTYFIPYNVCEKEVTTLRITQPRNGSKPKRWAVEYEI